MSPSMASSPRVVVVLLLALAAVGPGLVSGRRHGGGGGYERVFDRQQADRVEALPGQPSDVGFRQFAGYVTVNETRGRALFYWFFEAAHGVQRKPLVLWLNGGPGCSSVGYGAAEELGPFLVQKGKPEIALNPHSWNKDANLLFLESPAGVGFSYTNTTEDLSQFGDALTAHDAHAFLVNWFKRFPQFKGHDFYITGESYAGHYVPQLAEKILEENRKAHKSERINLKGIMIGNAAIDSSSDDRGLAEYAWDHAVISDEVYGAIKKECSFSDDGEESDACSAAWDKFFDALRDIDLYSLYTPACTDAMVNSSASAAVAAGRRFSKQLHRVHRGRPYNTYDPCADYHVIDYLNRADVQAALHANVSGSIPYKWSPCSDALTKWGDSPASTLPVIKGLVGAGLRVWVFSGDTDDRVPVTSTRYALHKLGLATVKPWREWFTSDQVGGYTVLYDGLTFVTVRGAGHMVPMITPVQASQLFAHFLAGKELPATAITAKP